ncbi:MAG: acyl-CoA carboxylase subunit epsilon [Geodermatophilaceae bacterium]|nr:acyl-CoA carboxylase subunit epsilon [Geodermatophilaceae bacterium]
MEDQPELSPPFLRIVRGEPSVEEVAALVAVLSAAASARPAAAPAPGYAWSARSRFVRAPLSAGSGGWRASALTR